MRHEHSHRSRRGASAILLLSTVLLVPQALRAGDSAVFELTAATGHVEMVANTSKILRSKVKIDRVAVTDSELLDVLALSPYEVQLMAKKPGVTHVNLWDDEGEIHSIDVYVDGDARQLTALLERLFPRSNLRVIPMQGSVIVTGYVDSPDAVSRIMAVAESFHPRVLNAIKVGGVRQVLLNVKVMEVQRSKLRALGFNFVNVNGDDFVVSDIGNVITNFSIPGTQTQLGRVSPPSAAGTFSFDPSAPPTAVFGVVTNFNEFIGFLEALRQENLLKILAEPKLVAISGRPASFLSGGEFPILVPQGLGQSSIEFREFGVRLEFVPIVLDNGRIRLEVRPEVSERDFSTAIALGGVEVPGLLTRRADTAVEMAAGQTLAIAGLISTRVQANTQKVPVLGELPYIGAAFRRVSHQESEVELLVMVTPELIEATDPSMLPPGGPGAETQIPRDRELFLKGLMEVPACGPGLLEGEIFYPEGAVDLDPPPSSDGPAESSTQEPEAILPSPVPIPAEPEAKRGTTGGTVSQAMSQQAAPAPKRARAMAGSAGSAEPVPPKPIVEVASQATAATTESAAAGSSADRAASNSAQLAPAEADASDVPAVHRRNAGPPPGLLGPFGYDIAP